MTPLSPPPFHARDFVPILTAAEMRSWDQATIDDHGVPEAVLMESAGRAAATLIHRMYPEGTVVGAVGAGNNGGDALVVLRTLRAWGRRVVAVQCGAELPHRRLLHGWDLEIRPAGEAADAFSAASVVVDGLLGTGAHGAPRPAEAEAIAAITASGRPVIALDGPSGVDLTKGEAPGPAIRAELTITFGAPKRGLLLFPGREHAGRIVAVEVGFCPFPSESAALRLITPQWAAAQLPRVPPNAHKGTTGTVTVVAGSRGMAGAALMAAAGAGRAGAGVVRIASAEENREILQVGHPEALFVDRASDEMDAALTAAAAVVIGPGMGTDAAALDVLIRAFRTGSASLVLDADALTLLSRRPDLAENRERGMLLTPHPGEMARLLDVPTRDVTGDPFGCAAEAAARFDCAVLLKGAPSVVAAPGRATLVNVTGHSGIATGGMGDTLAGVAGAHLAAGAESAAAAGLALYYCGRAAEIAGRGRSLLPRDVAEALPDALAQTPDEAPAPDFPFITLDLPAAH